MRITQSYKKWFFLPFIFLAVLYACTSEQDYQTDTDKPMEPLTVSTAQSLYEQYIGRSQLKSSEEGAGVGLTPDWDKGQVSSDSNWYVVESPMEFTGGRQIRLIAPGVEEYSLRHTNPSSIRQYQRLVMAQNKASGETYAFVMLVVPGLDYMLRKGDELEKNRYFGRDSDLDGMVMFYTTDGLFVNGWVYESGRITAGLKPETEQSGLFSTKAGGGICYGYTEYYYEDGEWKSVAGVTCIRPSFKLDELCNCSSGGGGIDFTMLPPITSGVGGSGGGNGSPAAPGVADDKKPDKRTDCSESATMNATNAQDAMTGNASIISKTNTLRSYATQNISKEYGMLIDIRSGSYQAGNIIEGIDGYINFQYTPYTAYDVHTHDETGGFSGHAGYTGFSVQDIYTTMQANKYYYTYYSGSASNPYKGSIVIAYDGSEYILSVNDAREAKDFFINNPTKFEANDESMFEDKSMYKEYDDIYISLSKIGYSQQDAHDYALTYLLDKYDTGLKISKKESGKNSFKEMKTEKTNNNYQPKICP